MTTIATSDEIRKRKEKRRKERDAIHKMNLQQSSSIQTNLSQKQTDRSIDDLLKSNKKLIDSSYGISVQTADQLAMDREKIKRIEKDTDNLDNVLNQSDKQIKKFNKFGSLLKSIFTSKKKHKQNNSHDENSEEKKEDVNFKYLNKMETGKQNEDEKIAELQRGVEKLKFVIDDTGKEINEQNEMLDRLHDKTKIVSDKITDQDNRLRKIH